MICYAIKNENEASEKLAMRFKKIFYQSRTNNKLRNEKTHQKKPTRRQIRMKAIVSNHYRSF
ncbi:hypothetical protein CSB09_04675 [Candidatus Gracilibacteria bacterium]|nr:MAG: hypothetical protein CSB09_04675 [Candidatus Gracilibacteria bacterium]